MNDLIVKKTVIDIVNLWNKKDFKSRRYARGKLRMSRWFLSEKTYNYLAGIMGESLIAEGGSRELLERIEEDNILREAQKIFGGEIIEK